MLRRKMPPVHPGIILKKLYLNPMGISVTDLAGMLYVSVETVSLIIEGQERIDADRSHRLGQAFGTSTALWLDMQEMYDRWN